MNLEGAENVILHQKSAFTRMNQHGVAGWHNIEQNMRRKSLEILTPILLIMIDNYGVLTLIAWIHHAAQPFP